MPAALIEQHFYSLRELLKRDHSLNGGVLIGLDGHIIELQARAMEVLRKPCPWRQAVTVTGMQRGAVTEALDRISGAFAKLDIPLPQVEILVNLAPPDLLKEGTWLDLPLAVIVLQAAGYLPDLPEHREGDFVLIGEVGIHGDVRRVPGALSLACRARPGQKLIVPYGNEKECALILAKPGHEGCVIYAIASLDEVIEYFQAKRRLENALRHGIKFENAIARAVDFGLIRGHRRAKDAAVICAAGGHNLLMIGPPGEGKSMLAGAIAGIMPRLADEEKVELTRIYSAYGALQRDGVAVTRRPFRSVHSTVSKQALIGGGSKMPRPGEITLSHLGILFLDEIGEFSPSALEAMRQPIESGQVSISRGGTTVTYPCRFTLVAAMNPCPCGFFGTTRCRCKGADIKKYQSKLSGPMLDRIDLQVELKTLTSDERFAEPETEVSPKLRSVVESARDHQRRRFEGTNVPFNAAIPGGQVLDFCRLSSDGMAALKSLVSENALSTRSMDRLAKVSRTVADLEGCDCVQGGHLTKAAQFVIGGVLRDTLG